MKLNIPKYQNECSFILLTIVCIVEGETFRTLSQVFLNILQQNEVKTVQNESAVS